MSNQDQTNDKNKSGNTERFPAQDQGTQNSNENSASGANKGNPGQYNENDAHAENQSQHPGESEDRPHKAGFGGSGKSQSPTFDDGSRPGPGSEQDASSQQGTEGAKGSESQPQGNTLRGLAEDQATSRGLGEDQSLDDDDTTAES